MDLAHTNRSRIGSASVGTNSFVLAPDFPKGDFMYIHVYTVSSFSTQSWPENLAISDSHAFVTDLKFTDLDLDIQG